MKKIYIIPGLGESCDLQRYQRLAEKLSEKGYSVVSVNPDWYKPLRPQLFSIEKDSILCGFSFGAVFAYLLADKYPCKKIIFASLSPIHTFSLKSLKDDYSLYMSTKDATILAKEIKSIKINLTHLKSKHVTLSGEKEEWVKGEKKAEIIVPNTRHYMSKKYIETIAELV